MGFEPRGGRGGRGGFRGGDRGGRGGFGDRGGRGGRGGGKFLDTFPHHVAEHKNPPVFLINGSELIKYSQQVEEALVTVAAAEVVVRPVVVEVIAAVAVEEAVEVAQVVPRVERR